MATYDVESLSFVKDGNTYNLSLKSESIMIIAEGTITNSSGSYTQNFTDARVLSTMKPVNLELGNRGIFNDDIIVETSNGSFNISCGSVSGTSTFKVLMVTENA